MLPNQKDGVHTNFRKGTKLFARRSWIFADLYLKIAKKQFIMTWCEKDNCISRSKQQKTRSCSNEYYSSEKSTVKKPLKSTVKKPLNVTCLMDQILFIL